MLSVASPVLAPLAPADEVAVMGPPVAGSVLADALLVDRALTSDESVQQMPSAAANPRDPEHVVIAYLDYSLAATGYAGIGVRVSRDGGATWQAASIPLPAGFDQGAAHPIVKFDDQGRAFVSFMAATFADTPPITNPVPRAIGHRSANGIFVSRSDDGGASWQAPVAVASHLYDGENKVPFEINPDLAIDTFAILPDGRPNPNYGNLYAVWSRYYAKGQYPGEPDAPGGSNIMIAVSRDGGQHWELQTESHTKRGPDGDVSLDATVIFNQPLFTGQGAPEGQGYENWAHVAVGPEGDVYVSQFLGAIFVVHHSTDGAKSFTHPDQEVDGRALFPFGPSDPRIGLLSGQKFRAQVVRAVAADPLRPGHVYVAEADDILDAQANVVDEGDIIFARSTDYGRTWQRTFRVGARDGANAVNDDNDGRSSTGLDDDVAGVQLMPRLMVDAQGHVALVWYDSRRDPNQRRLDVFAAVSADGGATFSPNFRVSSESFDPDDGRFTDAAGNDNFYLGDLIGMAVAGGRAYFAWTDTRAGNQDIFFRRVALDALPAASNDRFEPNDGRTTATDLGKVVAKDAPKLSIGPAEEDWFRVTTGANGILTVRLSLEAGADGRLELYDGDGAARLTTAEGAGNAAGAPEIVWASPAGQTYLVRVLPGEQAVAATRYALTVRSWTGDLGSVAHRVQAGALSAGEDLYALRAAAAGTLDVTLERPGSPAGAWRLELLDPKDFGVLATAQGDGPLLRASLNVMKDQPLYVRVSGDDAAQGSYRLAATNFDQFSGEAGTLFFTTGAGPSAMALGDLNGDGALDIAVSHIGRDVVSVLINNGDGTYRAPREFAVGAFQAGGPFALQGAQNYGRNLAIADLDGDGRPDIVAVNTSSSDVSVLMGNGDGTFRPQRRFDATAAPLALAVGDVDGDGVPDVVVEDSTASTTAQIGVLLGRGDGTFHVPIFFALPDRESNRTTSLRLADVDGDGRLDLVERDFFHGVQVLLGNGDGTFRLDAGTSLPGIGPGLAVADLDLDGRLDLVATKNNSQEFLYALGNGDGSFQEPFGPEFAGQFSIAVAVADFATAMEDGSVVAGVPDGRPDLIVANNGRALPLVVGPPEIVVLAGLVDAEGGFDGFSDPVRLADVVGPLDVNVGDVDGDGVLDVIAVDRSGILVIFGRKPHIQRNDNPQTARRLDSVAHVVEPTLTIVPGHGDAYYTLLVPQEAYPGAGDQVLDFSAGFAAQGGAGLMMEVLDAAGNVLASGERLRLRAAQDTPLLVRVFGVQDAQGIAGTGAYTLVIDTLPQVAAVESHSFLPGADERPGGPTTSIVLVFQGDRLDAAAAEDAANYRVVWLGPDGLPDSPDDQAIPIGMGLTDGARSLVYNAGSNVDVASGRTYPTAVRQTVTLLFGEPLPEGSYRIEVLGRLGAQAFSEDEAKLLSRRDGFGRHAVVQAGGGSVSEGAVLLLDDLVRPAGPLGDFTVFEQGTRFLTQFHNDLGALLDALLSRFGDEAFITDNLLAQIVAALGPALGPDSERLASLWILFLDPVSFGVVDPSGASLSYNLQSNAFVNALPRAFVQVGSNVELVAIPNPLGVYGLDIANIPARARGGSVYFGEQGVQTQSLTSDLRGGESQFSFFFGALRAGLPLPPSVPDAPPSAPVSGDVGIASALAALGNLFSLALSAVSVAEALPAKSAAPSPESTAATPGLAPRATGAGGRARRLPFASLEAILNLLANEWPNLVQELDGGGAADAQDGALPRVLRAISRIFDELSESGTAETDAAARARPGARPAAPHGTPGASSGQHSQGARARQAYKPAAPPDEAKTARTGGASRGVEEAPPSPRAPFDTPAKSTPTSAQGSPHAGRHARAPAS